MLQMGTTRTAASEISYLGASGDDVPKAAPRSSDFNFNPGDEMRFTGYVTGLAGNVDYGVIYDAPEASTEYLFDIANNPPNQPSEITGEDYVPVNATDLVYEVEAVEGLVYLWSVPDSWEITHGQGSHAITVDAGGEGGEISVKAENNCGISEASLIFVEVHDDGEPTTVIDIDGNVYETVIFGSREWMAENLRVTRYNNGDTIPAGLSDSEWSNTTSGAFTIYPHGSIAGLNSDEEVVEAYGALYNWHAVTTGNLCPAGWSVPSDAEWAQLVNHLMDEYGYHNDPSSSDINGAGNALKSCRRVNSPEGGDCDTYEHPRWNEDTSGHNHYGFDAFDFSALPGGRRYADGSFGSIGIYGSWWSSTLLGPFPWVRMMGSSSPNVFPWRPDQRSGLSIRCLRDTDTTFHYLNLEVVPTFSGSVTGAGVYGAGEQLGIAADAPEGWHFANWSGDTEYLDNENAANAIVTMPNYDVTLTANFLLENDPDIIYGDGVTDIDGNEYVTVIIGDQEWMAENLRVTKYNNSDAIPTGLSDADWSNTTDGAYAIYDHNAYNTDGLNSPEEMVAAYGKLYNWYAAADQRGICPPGWSVPSDDDWTQLVDFVVAQGYSNETYNPNGAGNALKSCRQVNSPVIGDCNTSEHPRWDISNTYYGFDEFGFSALPGGHRGTTITFSQIGHYGRWWSSTESSPESAWFRDMRHIYGNVLRSNTNKTIGSSLRCFRDLD